ncbi:putative disease resistance RPP13-like protein 1 isoform X1 [Arachis hypogaea]
MAAALVGGAFLSSFLNVLFDRLSDPEIINLIRGKKLSEKMIQRFKAILNAAEGPVNDAERRQIREGPVKIWLDDLKDAIYEADDFLDEIATKAATKKDQGNFLTRFKKERKKVTRMEDVIGRLESIVNQKDTLGLKEIPMENMSWRTLTVVLFEGWMLDFKPLPTEVVKAVDLQVRTRNSYLVFHGEGSSQVNL